MSKNIYLRNTWLPNTEYIKNDFVYRNGDFYYATANHRSLDFNSDFLAGFWNGMRTDSDGTFKPYFFWRPSYNSDVNQTPRVVSVKFGDGYEQRMEDGIHNMLLEFDLKFDNRDIHEFTAIVHFFTQRKGVRSFLYLPLEPYSELKRFLCRSWSSTYLSFNNNSINAKFEEVPV